MPNSLKKRFKGIMEHEILMPTEGEEDEFFDENYVNCTDLMAEFEEK